MPCKRGEAPAIAGQHAPGRGGGQAFGEADVQERDSRGGAVLHLGDDDDGGIANGNPRILVGRGLDAAGDHQADMDAIGHGIGGKAVEDAPDQRVRCQANGEVERLLEKLKETARDKDANLMPVTIEAVKARASMGEIVDALKEIYGTYTETPVF